MSRELPVFAQRLPRGQRWSLYLIGLAVAVTGIAWWAFILSGASEDPFATSRATQHLVTVIHGVTSLAMIGVVGSMLTVHVRLGWRFRNSLVSGLSLLTALIALCASGAALYYVSGDSAREYTALGHEIAGVVAIVVFVVHRFRRRA